GGGVGGSVDASGTEKSVDVIPLRDKCNTDRSAASEASSFVPTRRPRKTQDARGETGEATEGISSSEDGAECFRDPERSPRPRRNSWELHQIAGLLDAPSEDEARWGTTGNAKHVATTVGSSANHHYRINTATSAVDSILSHTASLEEQLRENSYRRRR
ncbi:unnamed protein product, partial [Sphacelaria rigidula]